MITTVVLFFAAVALTFTAAFIGLVKDLSASKPLKTNEEIASADQQYESDRWAHIFFKVWAALFWLMTVVSFWTHWT